MSGSDERKWRRAASPSHNSGIGAPGSTPKTGPGSSNLRRQIPPTNKFNALEVKQYLNRGYSSYIDAARSGQPGIVVSTGQMPHNKPSSKGQADRSASLLRDLKSGLDAITTSSKASSPGINSPGSGSVPSPRGSIKSRSGGTTPVK